MRPVRTHDTIETGMCSSAAALQLQRVYLPGTQGVGRRSARSGGSDLAV